MPYRRAPLWLAILVPLIVVAFWPRYFGQLRAAPFALHAHGLTASTWIALALLQSWSATRTRMALHRLTGRAVFVAVPAFTAGATLAMQALARGAVAGNNPFNATYGMRLAMDDLTASIAFLALVWIALAGRRQVAVHAAAMMATILLVLPPVTARLLQLLPLPVERPFDVAFHVTQLASAGVALWLGRRGGRSGLPMRIAAGAILVQMLFFETIARSDAWARTATWLASAPVAVAGVGGIALGVAVCWWGWRAGAAPRQPGSDRRVASAGMPSNNAGSVPVIHT